MTGRGKIPVASWLLAVVGVLSLLPASQAGTAYLLVAAGGLVGWAVASRRIEARLPQNVARASDAVAVSLIVGLAAMRFSLSQASLVSIGYVLAAAQLSRVFRPVRPRDVTILNGTALAQVALAAFLTRDAIYLPILVAAVILGSIASLSAPEGAGVSGDVRIFFGRPVGRAGLRSRVGLFVEPGLLSGLVLGLGFLVFMALPRGAMFEARAKPAGGQATPAARPAPAHPGLREAQTEWTGFTEHVGLGDIGEVKQIPREAFTVKLLEGGAPVRVPKRLLYFRGAVLDSFDGRSWRRASDGPQKRWLTTRSGTGLLGIHPELDGFRPDSSRIRQQFRLRASPFRALPALGTVVGIDLTPKLPGVLELGADTFACRTQHPDGFSYTVVSQVSRTPGRPALREELSEAARARLTRLYPGAVRVARAARRVTRTAHDEREKIRLLTSWLRQRCSYTLRFSDSPPAHPLDRFLFTTHAGHCEYFATALAMLLRAVDVPTRLVAGFRGGQWIESEQAYFVRMSNAHAWDEAFVEGAGWVRVDPTPSDSSAVAVPYSRVPGSRKEPRSSPSESIVAFVRGFGPGDRERVFGAAGDAIAFLFREGLGWGRPHRWWPPPIPVLLGAWIAYFFLRRIRNRGGRRSIAGPSGSRARRSPPPPPARFYEEALGLLAEVGEVRTRSQSPREFLATVLRRQRGSGAFRTITIAFERVRYGLAPPTPEQDLELHTALASLREELSLGASAPLKAGPDQERLRP